VGGTVAGAVNVATGGLVGLGRGEGVAVSTGRGVGVGVGVSGGDVTAGVRAGACPVVIMGVGDGAGDGAGTDWGVGVAGASWSPGRKMGTICGRRPVVSPGSSASESRRAASMISSLRGARLVPCPSAE
jgi:hypothetical protein